MSRIGKVKAIKKAEAGISIWKRFFYYYYIFDVARVDLEISKIRSTPSWAFNDDGTIKPVHKEIWS